MFWEFDYNLSTGFPKLCAFVTKKMQKKTILLVNITCLIALSPG